MNTINYKLISLLGRKISLKDMRLINLDFVFKNIYVLHFKNVDGNCFCVLFQLLLYIFTVIILLWLDNFATWFVLSIKLCNLLFLYNLWGFKLLPWTELWLFCIHRTYGSLHLWMGLWIFFIRDILKGLLLIFLTILALFAVTLFNLLLMIAWRD